MKCHHLYVIVFPNRKRYFGITNSPDKRWKRHLTNQSDPRREHYPLYQALRKYRPENCKFKVLQSGTFEEMERLEVIRIARYKTWVPKWGTEFGYNTLPGGGLGRLGMKNSPEQCLRHSLTMKGRISSRKGKKITPETRVKISGLNHHGYGKPAHNRGKLVSEESKAKMRKPKPSARGSNNHASKLTDALVWEVHEAHGTQRGIAKSYGISQTLVRKIKQHKTRIWLWTSTVEKIMKNPIYK